MAKVLALYSSLMGDNGNSTALVNEFLKKFDASDVTKRDLVNDALPHLTLSEMGAWMTPADQHTDEQKALAAISNNLIEELKAHDTVVVGMPMYNFGIPSQFKAYIDRIARAGITFKYTETGPVGLLEGKKVYVLCARGGIYAGTPNDSQTPYLKSFFGFIGLTDVEFVYAEGLNMGEESKAAAVDKAHTAIANI
ncbi:FMN-dependent NADH-azoreductase [Pokkaliibacter sp. CJK22405]|uniref:FMN-dependent NADH-azoreductase n=1 Tax=Pokkaliibacter sp. CJK22405 TaxID=3384615 RepID=UPI003985086F